MPTVAVIGGSGALGSALSLRLAEAGVEVALGSRSKERADESVQKLLEKLPGAKLTAYENNDAAQQAEVVILTVPFRNQSETLQHLKTVLAPGQIIVDTTVPLAAAISGKATRTIGVWQGSAAQQVQEMVPEGVGVVAALHTVSAKALGDLDHSIDEDVLICGDKKAEKLKVAQLIDLIPGLRSVNCGKLEMARIVEQITPLLISVNMRYKTSAGIKLTDLPTELWD